MDRERGPAPVGGRCGDGERFSPPASALPLGPGPRGQRSADARFITRIIPHHEGAIAMAELALSRAQHPELRRLEAAMVRVQSEEIDQMERGYSQWFNGKGR